MATPATTAVSPGKQRTKQRTGSRRPNWGAKRSPGRPWGPGQSGNPRGRPPLIVTLLKSIPPEMMEKAKDVAAFVLDDPNYQENVIRRIMQGRAPHVEVLLWHHRYGPPPQTVRHEGDVGIDFAEALKKAWAALQAAGDPRVPKAIGPAPTIINVLPQRTVPAVVPTNGRRDGRVYVGPEDQEDDSEELWPGDIR